MSENTYRKEIHTEYSFLLLAGGKSSRMGEDKSGLLFQGKTFLQWQLEKAEHLGIKEQFLSGHNCQEKDVQVVLDVYESRGPLGGLHACMKKMKTPYCLVLPVDAPQVPVSLLDRLLFFHQSKEADRELPLLLSHGDRVEPLMGIYPVTAAGKIEELIREHSAPVFQLLDFLGYEPFFAEEDFWKLGNINTPKDYEWLLETEKRGKKR